MNKYFFLFYNHLFKKRWLKMAYVCKGSPGHIG